MAKYVNVLLEDGTTKKMKIKHHWWKYLLCFLLGLVFLPASIVVGGIIFANTVKTSTILSWVNVDGKSFLTEKYLDSTVMNMVNDFSSGKVSPTTLNGLNEITPIIQNTINDFKSNNDFSVDFVNSIDTLYNNMLNVNFEAYGDVFFDKLTTSFTLKSFINPNIFPDDSPFKSVINQLLYKEAGALVTLKDLIDGKIDIESSINDLEIKSFLDESMIYKYVNNSTHKYSNEKSSGFVDNPSYVPLLAIIADFKVGTIGDSISSIKIVDLFSDVDKDSIFGTIISAVSATASIIDAASAFSSAFDTLTLSDLFDDFESSPILNALKDYKISELGDGINNMKITDVFADKIYDSNHEITGIWSYLLNDPNKIKNPTDYTINDFDVMTNNISINVQNTSINDLVADGIIETPANFTNQNILYNGGVKKIGELTLNQLFEAISSLLN